MTDQTSEFQNKVISQSGHSDWYFLNDDPVEI
jgi:hypothetical protein